MTGVDVSVDVSVVVTAHAETFVAGPTMRSADRAVAAARAAGRSIETIVCLDAATAATEAYFAQPRFEQWRRVSVTEGDLGGARNAVLPHTTGRYLAFLDADDLFGVNWLVDGLDRAERAAARGERVILHPEVNVFFDGQRSVLVNLDQDAPLFTPQLMYFRNYYDALCLAPREAYEQVPYRRIDPSRGIGFEDWQWAIETMAAGWVHRVARDTVIFKRRRDRSLLSTSRGAVPRFLEPMAIDSVADLAAPRQETSSNPHQGDPVR